MNNSDLHTHSYYSDGEFKPSEIVKMAKQMGIKNLALTDHNSVDGITEAVKEGKKQGINIIPAIELNANENEVLGYFIDYKNKSFQKELKQLQFNTIDRIKKIIAKLNEKGIKISLEDVLKQFQPNKNVIEIHLIKCLYFQGLGEINQLWIKYISKDGETYVPAQKFSVVDAIKLIRKYNGVPVLPHSWISPSAKELLKEENFKKLIEAGLMGIEIDNGGRDARRDDKTVSRINELAKKYKLIITSGSDFHGEGLTKETGTHELGKYNCDEKVVEQLKNA